MAWISGSPSIARLLTSNTPSDMKLESKRAVSAVSKAITHRYSASTTASRPGIGGLRTTGRENAEAMLFRGNKIREKFEDDASSAI